MPCSSEGHGVLLTIAYDGSHFSGFARQANARTVSGELEGAIRELDPRASLLRGVSRTDAGVHARGQIAAFDTTANIPPRGWVLGLLPHLDKAISVLSAARVAAGFDPRAHAVRKHYRYVILQSRVPDPFLRRRAWRLGYRLSHDAMRREAQTLLGRHDFAAFRGSADQRTDTVRTMVRADVSASTEDPRCLRIDLAGDRFLYHMVRIIVGTLVDVGRGKLAPGAVTRALASRSRDDLGVTAPPDGLYLEHVELEVTASDNWPYQSSTQGTP